MGLDVTAVVKEIDDVLTEAAVAAPQMLLMGTPHAAFAISLLTAAIERLAPVGGYHHRRAREMREQNHGQPAVVLYNALVGFLQALRADYAGGRLQGVRELIHGELFSDLLDAAQHLVDEGYKDPAAVLAGSSLEAHLRRLADKHNVPTTKSDGSAKKASMLKDDLAKTTPPALSAGDVKNATAWLALRNDAAHGHYASYTKEQVALLIQSVRDFITRMPA